MMTLGSDNTFLFFSQNKGSQISIPGKGNIYIMVQIN